MRIWRFHSFGDLGSLELEHVPDPVPAHGEIRVRLDYAALNPADRYLILGQYPRAGEPPLAVGRDGCGVADTDGQRFKKGEEVVLLRSDLGVSRDGTLAEYVCVPEVSLAPLPEDWTSMEGAAGPLVHLTAWQALVDVGKITGDDTVLITGASGGVGTAALVQAKGFGARVIATSRSEEKRERLLELGADAVVDSSAEDYVALIKNILKDGRVSLVVENLAGPFLQKSIDVLAEGGRIAVVGLLAGLSSEVSIGTLLFKRARIEGVQVGAYTPEESQHAWNRIVSHLAATGARPLVDEIFPMTEVPEAFEYLKKGPFGKVLVDVRA
jgi:NADPH2:quinone reductase